MKPVGRPRKDAPTQKSIKISVRVDIETKQMLEALERRLSLNVSGRRSVVVRDAIREKFERDKPS